MNAKRRQSGSTFFEAIFVVALFASLLTSFISVYSTTTTFSTRSTAQMRANEEQQRNLGAIANLLRGAALTSLGGFDANGNSTAPTFQVVTGVDGAGNRVLGPAQMLSWRSTGGNIHGVPNPGEVTVSIGGVATKIASRVPNGGFRVNRTANTLRVTLTSFYTMTDPNQTVATTTGDVSIALRN